MRKKNAFSSGLLILFLCSCSHKEIISQGPILWNSDASKLLFQDSENTDFFQLSNFFEPQINRFACGLSTGTTLLNYFSSVGALKIERPMDWSAYPLKENYMGSDFVPVFQKFTQKTFLNEKTDSIKTLETFYGKENSEGLQDGGLSLEQFAKIMKSYHMQVNLFHVDNLTKTAEFKKIIIDSLRDSSSFIVVNFDRKKFFQTGSGHLSPLVAFNAKYDKMLVLDVNPEVSQWFWVSSDELFSAMNTKDGESYRGFLKISPL